MLFATLYLLTAGTKICPVNECGFAVFVESEGARGMEARFF